MDSEKSAALIGNGSDFCRILGINIDPVTYKAVEDATEEAEADWNSQTPRGIAILAVAYLDDNLIKRIKLLLPQWELPASKYSGSKKLGESVFGSETKQGTLGFLDKCRMAFCLGAIGPVTYRDLERVNRIRNRFAHQAAVRTFDDPVVRQHCQDFETYSSWSKTPVDSGEWSAETSFRTVAKMLGWSMMLHSLLVKNLKESPYQYDEKAVRHMSPFFA